MTDSRKSLVEELEEDPRRSPGFYAAQLAMDVQMLLHRALESRQDMSLEDISDLLGVDVERVRWAYSLNDVDHIPEGMSYLDWNSDGNMYTASMARFFKVLGYELEIKVKAIDEKSDEEYVNHRPRRGDGFRRHYRNDGISTLAVNTD
jgi:hypothetical protein